MEILLQIIIATLLVSLISLIGLFILSRNTKRLQTKMLLIVAFAAGTMLGTVFFHLVPESFALYDAHSDEGIHIEGLGVIEDNHALEEEHESEAGHAHEHGANLPSIMILAGILLFYIIEKFIHWHHHHDVDCHKHSLSRLAMIGDAFHNFLDGAVIAVAFTVSTEIGIITTIAIALHEIPQELGDFAILIHSGMSRGKALFINFLSGTTAILGGLIAYFFVSGFQNLQPLLLALTAGSFIYISLADIVPEINKSKEGISRYLLTVSLFFGIALTFLLTFIGH
ncbi:MAG: ZIP family metal transporter [Nanoarchaeota archaeon]